MKYNFDFKPHVNLIAPCAIQKKFEFFGSSDMQSSISMRFLICSSFFFIGIMLWVSTSFNV